MNARNYDSGHTLVYGSCATARNRRTVTQTLSHGNSVNYLGACDRNCEDAAWFTKHRHNFVIPVENIDTLMNLACFLILQLCVEHVGQSCFASACLSFFLCCWFSPLARLVDNFDHSFWLLLCPGKC